METVLTKTNVIGSGFSECSDFEFILRSRVSGEVTVQRPFFCFTHLRRRMLLENYNYKQLELNVGRYFQKVKLFD